MSSSFVDLLRSGVQGASNAAASNVSGPVDLLAWLLRKGGVPVPSNAFGGSEWMRQQGLTAEPKNKLAGMLGEGVGLAAPFAIAAKAPQIAGAMNKADDALTAGANRMADHFERTGAAFKGPPNQRGAIVYHGSPHKFDRFDSSKIGTGEGGAVYGDGINLSSAQKIAQDYTRDQRGMAAKTMADKMLTNWGDRAKAIEAMQGRLQKAEQELIPEAVQPYRDALQMLQSGDHTGGGLYKVDLPDAAIGKMVAWDKPINEQSPEVLAALERAGINTQSTAKAGPMVRGQERHLSKFGVTGVRYPYGDAQNFVVFPGNEGLLNILERNGSPINALVQALKGPR